MVDPLPYMTYQPFLPEVAAGSVEARHAIVSLRRHLLKTSILAAEVRRVNHGEKKVTIRPLEGEEYEMSYDIIVITAGAVSRTFPIPGIADHAIGLKTIEEAVYVRDRILSNFDLAANMKPGPERQKLLTVTVVGGGFAGVELFAELRSFVTSMLRYYKEISNDEVHFHLIEASSRIMPEVSLSTSQWVLKNLDKRGAKVHLDTQLMSAVAGKIELSTGETYESDLIVWTAGILPNVIVTNNTDLFIEERGRILTRPDLRVGTDDNIVEDAWAAGDISAVPDHTGESPTGYYPPNAQNAVRQAKLLAKNLVAVLRDEKPREYVHKNLGIVAGLGLGVGVMESRGFVLKGALAWIGHRFYHGLAMPSWERKWRVLGGWWNNFWLGRDIVSLTHVQSPLDVFHEFALRPEATAAIFSPLPGLPEGVHAEYVAAHAAAVQKVEESAALGYRNHPEKTLGVKRAQAIDAVVEEQGSSDDLEQQQESSTDKVAQVVLESEQDVNKQEK